MNPETISVALQSLLSLSVLAWLLFWGWPAYRLDRYRQGLFDIRDRLFDYAAAGNIDFDHAAYGTLRITINGFIRHAHRISFCHVVLMSLLNKRYFAQCRESFSTRWERNLSDLPQDVQMQLRAFLLEVNLHSARHILGYAADILIYVVKSLLVATRGGITIKALLLGVRDNMDTAACVCGDDIPTSHSVGVTTACSVLMFSESNTGK